MVVLLLGTPWVSYLFERCTIQKTPTLYYMHVIHPMGLPQAVSSQDVVSAPKPKLLPQMQNWEPAVIPHCASGPLSPASLHLSSVSWRLRAPLWSLLSPFCLETAVFLGSAADPPPVPPP